MKKNFMLIAFTLVILSLTGCSVSDQDLKNYIYDKYNFKVKIISRPLINDNGGRSSFKVQRVDLPELEFSVYVEGFFDNQIKGDNYKESYIFYKYNQEYMKSELYEKFNKLGFEKTFLKVYFTRGNGFKGTADLFLFKPEGMNIDEKDFSLLQKGYPLIEEAKRKLAHIDYELNKVHVYDLHVFNRFYLNDYDNKEYQIMNEVSIDNDSIEKMNTVDGVKEAIFSDRYNRDALISYHFFKKEENKVSERMPELKRLGFEPDESNFSGFIEPFLSCEDGNGEYVSYESLNLDACKSYFLHLQMNNTLPELAEESKKTQVLQMLSIVQSINLPINKVSLSVNDGDAVDYLTLEEIHEIKDIQALDAVLDEQLPGEE